MKFLIQTFNGEIRHDFAFTLLESIRFKNWSSNNNKKDKIIVKFLDYIEVKEPDDIYPIQFKPYHKNYVPVGSVEFVTDFIHHFYGLYVKPINVPEELFDICFTQRKIYNGTHMSLENQAGTFFVKSNDQIKYFTEMVDCNENGMYGTLYSVPIPVGNHQISEYLRGIESEWRAFVYKGKLVGLQNYSGEFTKFPKVSAIKSMIYAYKSAPVAYTLDVAVCDYATVIIEVHDFFSCGLYGFANHAIYPQMLHQWFWQYIQREMVEHRREKL
jgi:hypothetical protein